MGIDVHKMECYGLSIIFSSSKMQWKMPQLSMEVLNLTADPSSFQIMGQTVHEIDVIPTLQNMSQVKSCMPIISYYFDEGFWSCQIHVTISLHLMMNWSNCMHCGTAQKRVTYQNHICSVRKAYHFIADLFSIFFFNPRSHCSARFASTVFTRNQEEAPKDRICRYPRKLFWYKRSHSVFQYMKYPCGFGFPDLLHIDLAAIEVDQSVFE